MKKVNKHFINRHGAATVFLAIILSALILVECTFVAYVWNLDYALTVNTALKTQIETILSDYNRQLFNVYGIYAFSIDGVDDECFNKALEINGLEAQSTLYVTESRKVTTDDLKTAISSYYSYRATGIAAKTAVETCGDLLIQLDENGILSGISEYMESPASQYVSEIIKGDDTAEEWIEKAGDALDIEALTDEITALDDLREEFSDMIHDSDIGLDVDIADWEGLLNTVSTMEEFVDGYSDTAPDIEVKFFIAHYCSHNFDCRFPPEGDGTINGTEFKSIHEDQFDDVEYLITGLDSALGVADIFMLIHFIITLGKLLENYSNETVRNTMEAIAIVIQEVLYALSEGTCDIDYRIITFGLMVYLSMIQAAIESFKLMDGDRAVLFKYDDTDIITMNYRDFLNVFCFFVPEETILERTRKVLERDYGDLFKGITLKAEFRGTAYYLEKSYQMYE